MFKVIPIAVYLVLSIYACMGFMAVLYQLEDPAEINSSALQKEMLTPDKHFYH